MVEKSFNKSKWLVVFVVLLCVFIGSGVFSRVSASSDIASLTIFSDGSGDSWGTHAFLYVKNTSNNKITVLGKSLASDEGMTIGTFGNKNEGKGIYINLEAFFIKEYSAYGPRVSLTTNLTKSELSTLNSKMKSCNKWTLSKNCAWFAVKAWNSVAPNSKQLSAGVISNPASLSKNIKKNSTYKKKKSVTGVNTDYVKRYKTNGTKSSVSSGTKESGSSSSGRSSK